MYELATQDNFTPITPVSDSELLPELSKISNFSEDFYLNTDLGVAEAVANGVFINGLEHYVLFGADEVAGEVQSIRTSILSGFYYT